MSIDKSILFTCAGYGGGIGKMLGFVTEISLGHFRQVMLMHRGRDYDSDYVNENVSEILIPIEDNLNFFLWRWKHIKHIRSVIKNIKPDIVCCFGSEHAFMVALSLIGIKSIKLIQCERGDPYNAPKKWKPFMRWAFHRAYKCVFQLQRQAEWYGKDVIDNSIIIPNAFVPSSNVKWNKDNHSRNIIGIGRFVSEKRFDVLIEAFKIVHTKHMEYKLIIYGDGPLRHKYEQIINDNNLQDFVTLPGYCHNAAVALSEADIFVLSSCREGMPNTLVEALAMGVPTVSTDCSPGGPAFLTDNGRRGLLVDVDDIKALSDSICRIIENPSLVNELSEKAQEIASVLNQESISDMWVQFLTKL